MPKKLDDVPRVKDEVQIKYGAKSKKVYKCLKKGEKEKLSAGELNDAIINKINKCVEKKTGDKLSDDDRTQIEQWISIG